MTQKAPQSSPSSLPKTPQNVLKDVSNGAEGQSEDSEIIFHYNKSKAGLENVDTNRINNIIMECSKGSEYHKSEQKRLNEVKEKVTRYKQKVAKYQANSRLWEKAKNEVYRRIELYKANRNFKRTWIHVDMDMFYAAVEIRDNPHLADKPVAVGDKSMISTTNYVARKYGVRSGIPIFIGKKLCPDLIIIKTDYAKYQKVSQQFKKICREFDEDLESKGLDEVNLDVTGYLRRNGIDHELGRIFVAEKIRRNIKEELDLTSSCGIACNNMLSKICSDVQKPNGITYLEFSEKEITKFLMKLPIRKVPGVGKVNELILSGLGINTCEEVLQKGVEVFINFTENSFEFLARCALGISRNVHERESQIQKSLSVSNTFKPVSELPQFKDKLIKIINEVADRVKDRKICARTITLELKNLEYKTIRRSFTTERSISTHQELMNHAIKLLMEAWPMEPIRLMGVRLNNLRKVEKRKRDNKSHWKDRKSNGYNWSSYKLDRPTPPPRFQNNTLTPESFGK
ncbi:unnamed protein product [Moneuplotes crassus]|uniref:DNA polymerase kappa n=1 Tax=Euplotes crassus TaxID=5936 RepID=A0AAD1XBH2_EUPCR|nr:unnamed protein product [Moneuplotes crassus]